MKTVVLMSLVTCLATGFGAGIAAERFALRREDAAILQELRATRASLAELQQSNSDCARTALLCSLRPAPVAASVSAAAGAASPGPASAPIPSDIPAPPPQSFAAFDEGQKLVASAMTRGLWTRQDRRDLLRLGRAMTDEQLSTLELRVTQAVNQDRIKLELP